MKTMFEMFDRIYKYIGTSGMCFVSSFLLSVSSIFQFHIYSSITHDPMHAVAAFIHLLMSALILFTGMSWINKGK